jgi:hypothetical protein
MKETSRIMKHMGKELITILSKIMNTLEDGKKISHMDEGVKNSEMDHITKDNFEMELSKELGTMFANQEYTRGNFLQEIFTVKEHLVIQMVVFTKENGRLGF